MKKKIAILIPTYRAHDTIQRTLHSIAMQTIIDTATVYICVDADGEDYTYLKQLFPSVDIVILNMEKNGGCGLARQLGIDNSEEPFITMIDSDDTFSSADALAVMLKQFENPKIVMASTTFIEETDKGYFVHNGDVTWMHGKMYRRSYLDKYQVRFGECRWCEDAGFNTIALLALNDEESLSVVNFTTYQWHWRDNSIVRSNNKEYTYNQAIIGYYENKIYAIEHAKKQGLTKDLPYEILRTMIQMFRQYITVNKIPEAKNHIQQTIDYHKKYHDNYYKQLDQKFINKVLSQELINSGFNKQELHQAYYTYIRMLNT